MRFHAARRPGLGEAEEQEEEGDIKLSELDINHIPLDMREYRVPSTGARVTLASAKPLLYMFCAKLPADRHALTMALCILAMICDLLYVAYYLSHLFCLPCSVVAWPRHLGQFNTHSQLLPVPLWPGQDSRSS